MTQQLDLSLTAADDLFAESKVAPTDTEQFVAGLLWTHRGRKDPISIDAISLITGLVEREVKATIAELICTHKIRIGAARGNPAGYYLIQDADDVESAVRPIRLQISAMSRRLRVIMGPRALREMLGQLAIEDAPPTQGSEV